MIGTHAFASTENGGKYFCNQICKERWEGSQKNDQKKKLLRQLRM